jgi:hypothetical protein
LIVNIFHRYLTLGKISSNVKSETEFHIAYKNEVHITDYWFWF